MNPTTQPNASGLRKPRAFSLLEVLIALALSVVVIGAISMAVRLHLITLEQQSKKIEYKQIARSVLMMVSNDLRNAVQYKPIDYSVLEELAASQLAAQGITPPTGDDSGGDTGGLGGDLGGSIPGGGSLPGGGDSGGGSDDRDDSSGDEEDSDPIAMDEEEVEGRPTLIGNLSVLSLDVSRIPRLDEYNSLTQNDLTLQLPSDIKTVVYFVEESVNSAITPKFAIISNAAAGGLYRRQIDRSVAAYLEEEGVNVGLDQYAELIAPEIAQIAFRYFDGSEWQETWDSLEVGGFPPAVEITVVIDPERMNAGGSYSYGGFDPETMERYRLVVALPTGDPVADGGAP